jgi:hypothetical protein
MEGWVITSEDAKNCNHTYLRHEKQKYDMLPQQQIFPAMMPACVHACEKRSLGFLLVRGSNKCNESNERECDTKHVVRQ